MVNSCNLVCKINCLLLYFVLTNRFRTPSHTNAHALTGLNGTSPGTETLCHPTYVINGKQTASILAQMTYLQGFCMSPKCPSTSIYVIYRSNGTASTSSQSSSSSFYCGWVPSTSPSAPRSDYSPLWSLPTLSSGSIAGTIIGATFGFFGSLFFCIRCAKQAAFSHRRQQAHVAINRTSNAANERRFEVSNIDI